MEFSKATISSLMDKIILSLKEWQQRPFETVYPVVWLDAIYYKVKEDGKYVSKAVYTILGVRLDGLNSFHEAIKAIYPKT